jgi:1,4-alpha-glucan branching enzyme
MAITKRHLKVRPECRVTFSYRPGDSATRQVDLCGDFTDWDDRPLPMKRQRDGSYRLSVNLPREGEFAFRYRLDGTHWDNDEAADAYTPNPFGTGDNGILRT